MKYAFIIAAIALVGIINANGIEACKKAGKVSEAECQHAINR